MYINTAGKLTLGCTDLMRSRNVSEWADALDKLTALKVLKIIGMHHYIEQVDETALDKYSTVETLDDARQRNYRKDGTFLDSAIVDGYVSKVEEATHATDIYNMCSTNE